MFCRREIICATVSMTRDVIIRRPRAATSPDTTDRYRDHAVYLAQMIAFRRLYCSTFSSILAYNRIYTISAHDDMHSEFVGRSVERAHQNTVHVIYENENYTILWSDDRVEQIVGVVALEFYSRICGIGYN